MTNMGEINPSQPGQPPALSELAGLASSKGNNGGEINSLLHAKIGNLGELKEVLVNYLGKKDGEKFYNQFMTSFAMIMLQQMQSSAKQAKGAEKGS